MNPCILSEHIASFIEYKHSIGYVYETQEHYLKQYLAYMNRMFPELNVPDKISTISFLGEYKNQPGGLYNAVSVLREFSRYLVKMGKYEAYLIPKKQNPKLTPAPPYFFSEAEIKSFFDACDIFCSERPKPRGRGLVLGAEFRILYCCGLRPKEARLLQCSDVHLQERYFDVLQSKGPKSRRIFINYELCEYLIKYDNAISLLFPERKYFFPRGKDKPYSRSFLNYDFELIWRKAFPDRSNKLPRIYDFRHHFAWANINRWARNGLDVNAMLPYLMKYMGHSKIQNTLYYFRFVPDFYSDYLKMSNTFDDVIPEAEYE